MINRDRIVNAVVFFAKNTNYCGKIKLFKLLYLLDFEHFKLTGKSVTGYTYQAWKFGPVPIDLMEEWEHLEGDLAAAVHIAEEQVIDYVRQTVKVNEGIDFDDSNFTPRQIRIMDDLLNRFRDTRSPEMIDVTHTQNGAWDKVWNKGMGAHESIPYELAIEVVGEDRQVLLEIAREQRMYEASLEADRASASIH